MTFHRDSHTTTDIKPEIMPGIQTGNGIPHDKYNIRGIAHACTNRKDNIFVRRGLYIDEAHMALEIFRFAVFFGRQCSIQGGEQVTQAKVGWFFL